MDDGNAAVAIPGNSIPSNRLNANTVFRRPLRNYDNDFEGDFTELPTRGIHRHESRGDLTVGQIFTALWRHKGTIILVMLCTAAIAFIGTSQINPIYLAQGIVSIDARPTYLPQLGGMSAPILTDIGMVRSEAQILSSRELIEDVARQLRLDLNPEFNPNLRKTTITSDMVKEAFDSLSSFTQIFRPEPDYTLTIPINTEERTWALVVSNVLRKLDASTDGKSYIIYVNFRGESPQLSAAIVNAIMMTFISNQSKYSTLKLLKSNAWIQQRVTTLKSEVEDADRAVQDYRAKHDLLETRMGTVSNQQLNELNTQLILARSDRAQADARYREAQAVSISGSTGDATAEVLLSPLIQRLREREAETAQRLSEVTTRLGPQHPSHQAAKNELQSITMQINIEIKKILQSLQNQVQIASTRERNLSQQLTILRSQEMKVAGAEIELNQLSKEADTKRNIYQEFMTTAQHTAEPSRFGQTLANIVSQAVPPLRPHGMTGSLYSIMGTLIGFLGAAGYILAIAERQRGFQTAGEIEQSLSIQVIGMVRKMRSFMRRDGISADEVKRNPTALMAETMRGILLALSNRYTDRPNMQVVLVTSALPKEGKTSFVESLGTVAAMDGRRVLIIDSDIRHPRLHRTFCRGGLPKLSDVLRGTEPLSSAVCHDNKFQLDCLLASDDVHTPGSLIMSGYWQELLTNARQSYDLIIMDSPPVMKVADAILLADYADAVVMIVQQNTTRQNTVREALRRILTTRAFLAGIVMTKVTSSKVENHRYYSGYTA